MGKMERDREDRGSAFTTSTTDVIRVVTSSLLHQRAAYLHLCEQRRDPHYTPSCLHPSAGTNSRCALLSTRQQPPTNFAHWITQPPLATPPLPLHAAAVTVARPAGSLTCKQRRRREGSCASKGFINATYAASENNSNMDALS